MNVYNKPDCCPSLMFTSTVKSLPETGAHERCFTSVGSGLACKHYIRLERLATEKLSGELRKIITDIKGLIILGLGV